MAVLANSFGNLLLAIGMQGMPDFSPGHVWLYTWQLVSNPYVLPGAALSAVYMVAQLSLFSWADLSFVVPVIATSYVVTAVLSKFILHEHVEMQRWLGVVLISLGVALVVRTPVETRPEMEEHGHG